MGSLLSNFSQLIGSKSLVQCSCGPHAHT